MGPRVLGRVRAVVVSAVLASLLAPGAVSGPFQVSPAVAVAKVAADQPSPPDKPRPNEPVPTEPELPPVPEPPPAPELPPTTEPAPAPEPPPPSEPAPALVPDQPAPPPSDPAPSSPGTPAPEPSAPDAPTVSERTGSSGSSQRGSALNGGARAGRLASDTDGGDPPAPVVGTGQTGTTAGLALFAPDRRGLDDSPIAALGFDGWSGASPGAPAIGSVPADAHSGVKGVAVSGGGVADADRSDRASSDGTLSPFGRDSSGGLFIVLGLLLALALLVRHELPRR
jgi:hypothetical protein